MNRLLMFVALIAALFTFGAAAQDADPRAVTLDEVNAVAASMFCPECENIPLDKCGTSVCVQWKDEIRLMLAQGQTPQQIRDQFVSRFGERVLAVPQDSTLRALSLFAPWVLAALAALIGVGALVRLRGREESAAPLPESPTSPQDDPYRARLERDLKG